MTALAGYRRLTGFLALLLKVVLVVVFALLVVDVLWGVATRYIFGSQASWSEELARLLMVWLALLGAALACREERHLGMDALVRLWPDDLQRRAGLFVHLAIIAFALIVMAFGGWNLVRERFASGQELSALGVARGWFYLPLPVSGVLITLFAAEALLALLVGEGVEIHDREEAGQ